MYVGISIKRRKEILNKQFTATLPVVKIQVGSRREKTVAIMIYKHL